MFPSNMPVGARIIGIAVPIIAFAIMIFTFVMMLSPKLRAKFMSKQLKATKYMLDDNKEDITNMMTTVQNAGIKAQQNIINENYDSLKDIANKNADIQSAGVETIARAIKKGLTEEMIYCKHCGTSIDHDSTFCKKCGKEQ